MSLERTSGLRGRQAAKPPSERFAVDYLPRYLRSPLSTPTYPVDVSAGITEWHMLGNGPDPTLTVNGGRPVGDCTFAGRQHLRMAKAAAARTTETWETADQLVAEYLAYDGGADRGVNIAEVLLHWFVTGKIRGFAPVDHSDPVSCDTVMAAFHGLYVGVDLTDEADAQFSAGEPWTVEHGERSNSDDGHCMVKVKADGHHFDTWVTWGVLQQSTREWTGACIREAWAIVTTEDQAAMLDMSKLVADIMAVAAAGGAATAAGDTVSDDRNLGATAFALGWQMAQLYGPLPLPGDPCPIDHLPSLYEYDTAARMDLGFLEMEGLLEKAKLRDVVHHAALEEARRTKDPDRRQEMLRRIHFHILDALVCDDERQAASYQLGRALSDTCWFPDTGHSLVDESRRVEVFIEQFNRSRLATLQGWLGQIDSLAPQTAPIISRSIQNWSDWIDANSKVVTRHWSTNEQAVVAALRDQSHAWHRLLSSEHADQGQPPMGAWIHAGESILRNTRIMVTAMLRRFWLAALLIVLVTAGLLYLGLRDAHGTARVWTALVTVAGSISLSGAGLRSGAQKVAGGLEQTVWEAAGLEARTWAITWLPHIRLGPVSRYRLRRRGVGLPTGGT